MSPTPDARIFENLTETRIIIAGANGKVLDIAPKGMIQGLPEWALKSKALHRHLSANRLRKLAGDDLPAPEEFAPVAVVDEVAVLKAENAKLHAAIEAFSARLAALEAPPAKPGK